MKREFLKGLGLEETVIDQIMDENGKDINVILLYCLILWYNSINKKIYIYQDADKYEVIHEIGHLIEYTVLKNNTEFLKIKKEIINNSSLTTINRDNRVLFALKNNNFVDEYQGYIHSNNINEIKDRYGKINPKYVTEIFSESFREYFEKPENLKAKLPKFYNMIKELLK